MSISLVLPDCSRNIKIRFDTIRLKWKTGAGSQLVEFYIKLQVLYFDSPSVLDRLNGLLEPGGMLSINERGVVDGDIPVVKPHPDFRWVFFRHLNSTGNLSFRKFYVSTSASCKFVNCFKF